MQHGKLHIHGIGAVAGFGQGQTALLAALDRGVTDPCTVDIPFFRAKRPLFALLADTSGLEGFMSKRELRRADHFSRLALLGACLALEDAGQLEGAKNRLGVIIATGYGPTRTTFTFLNSVINDGDALASPTHFSSSVHNAAAAYLSMLLNITGPCLTVSQFEMSFGSALLTAKQWLLEKRVDTVLLGAVDEYCDVLGYCWWRYFNGYSEGEMRPLDFSAQTALPGEGAAFFVLSDEAGGQFEESNVCIHDVSMGSIQDPGFFLPTDAPLFLGADGHRQCGKGYEAILTKQHTVAAYSPLYGSLPTGQGLDMAVAALSLKTGIIFKQPGKELKHIPLHTITRQAVCASNGIRCLKLGSNQEFGIITLQRQGVKA